MALLHLQKERKALTASQSGHRVTVIGVLQKGEKDGNRTVDLGYFKFKATYGSKDVRDALEKAFLAKFGPQPKSIYPLYLPETTWFDVNPDKQVMSRVFHMTSAGGHIIAEGNGEFVTAYRTREGGKMVIPTEPMPQPKEWAYTVKYDDKKTGKKVSKEYKYPFVDSLQLTLIVDELQDYLPEKIRYQLPGQLAVNFYSKAAWEVSPMYAELSHIRDMFLSKDGNPHRAVPCNVTPLALYRHEIDEKRIIEDGQEMKIRIYPTHITMAPALTEAYNKLQRNQQELYLQYVSTGHMLGQAPEIPHVPLAIAPPEPLKISGDVNDILFGEREDDSTHVEVKTKPVASKSVEIEDGDYVEATVPSAKEPRDIIKATLVTFREMKMVQPNLSNNKAVLETLWEFNTAVGGELKTEKGLKDVVAKLLGEEPMTPHMFENVLIYIFRTSEMCEKEFGKKDSLLDAKMWWDAELNAPIF